MNKNGQDLDVKHPLGLTKCVGMLDNTGEVKI